MERRIDRAGKRVERDALLSYGRENGCVQQSIQKTMKLSVDIAAPLLASFAALRPTRRLMVDHGAIVYKAFAPGRTYVVQEGCVRLIHVEKDGRTSFYHLVGAGGLFGDLPFAVTTPQQTEYAVASGSTYLLECSRAALEREAARSQKFNRILVRAYGAFLSFGERRLQWQLTTPLARRAALILTDLLYFGAGPCPHGPGYAIHIRMTQEEFAELFGVARQTLNALIREWKKQKIVSYTRSCFCIRNLEALQRMAS
ncbi:MAG TPA: Crp/Fnr family transcriptional regulator [Nitrospira sp.]|nr:Crp/Fnr family transcriptional regulator [Nitrospira sp.]